MAVFTCSWVEPTTLSDGRSHMFCGLGRGVARNGILATEQSMSVSIHEGAEDSGAIDWCECFKIGIGDFGSSEEVQPVTPAAIVLGLRRQTNSLFLG